MFRQEGIMLSNLKLVNVFSPVSLLFSFLFKLKIMLIAHLYVEIEKRLHELIFFHLY